MNYSIKAKTEYGMCNIDESQISFISEMDSKEIFFTMEFAFPDWEDDCYELMTQDEMLPQEVKH